MTTPTPLARAAARLLIALAILAPAAPPSFAARGRVTAVKEAPTEWVKVTYTHNGKPYTFYYPKNAPYTNDGGHERLNLYKEPVLEDKYMARSHLWRAAGSNAGYKLHIITESEQGAASDVVKAAQNWTEAPYRAPTPQPAQPPARRDPPAEDTVVRPAPTDPAPVTRRPQEEPPPVGPGTAVGADQGPVDELGREVLSDAQFEDVAKRIAEFTWKPLPDERTFIDPEARSKPDQEGILAGAIKTAVKQPEGRQLALWVYYVIGAGPTVPAWVQNSTAAKKYLLGDRGRLSDGEKLLADCLGRWQHDPKGQPLKYCSKQPDQNQVRQPYKGDPTWVQGYLADAGKEAQHILHAINRGLRDIVQSVGGSPTTAPTAPGGDTGERRTALPQAPAASFGVEDLFGAWGDRNVFHIDGRILTVVLRTRRSVKAGSPPKVEITQQLGLYDISDPSNIYGRRFNLDKPGKWTYSLTQGGKEYNVELSAKGSDTLISVTRPGFPTEVSSGGNTLPSVNELYQMRAQKALASGNRVMVGGKAYRVTGEAAGTGNLVFWDEEMLEKNRSAITGGYAGVLARAWTPAMMTPVNQMRGGVATNIGETASLGLRVGEKWQGLRWNKPLGIWEVAEGDEFKPAPDPVPAPPTSPSTSTSSGNQPSGARPDGPNSPNEGLTLGNGRAYSPDGPRAKALNAALTGRSKERARFLEDTGADYGLHLLMVVDNDKEKIGHPNYLGRGAELQEFIAEGRYLVTKGSEGSVFLDLETMELRGAVLKGQVGIYNPNGGGNALSQISDRWVLGYVGELAGYKGDDNKTLLANLDKGVQLGEGKPWLVSGTIKKPDGHVHLIVGGTRCITLWPKFDDQGCSENAPGQVPGAGTGLLLEAPTSPTEDVKFYRDYGIQGSGTAKLLDQPKPDGAALYLLDEGSGKKRWYIMVVSAGDEGKPFKRSAVLAFRTKDAPAGSAVETAALPGGLGIGGLKLKGKSDASYYLRAMPAAGEDLVKKGFLGAYTSQNATQCVGVVAWWGVDEQAACDRCGGTMNGGVCVAK